MLKNLIFTLSAALLLLTSNISKAQHDNPVLQSAKDENDHVIEKIIELGRTQNMTTDHLDILCNRFGGRITGSDACENVENWCEYMFRKWGLEVWRQEVGELPVGFNRGPWFGRMIGGNGMTLHFVTPSYTAGTKGVQRGHVVIEPKTQEEFDQMKGTLKGAWVLIGGKSNGWPIDFSAKEDSVRAQIIAFNTEATIKNREIQQYNREVEWAKRKNPKEKRERKELIKLKSAPALFYRQMKEAGILGIIQSSPVPMTALYDRKNINNMSFDNLPDLPDIKLDQEQYRIIENMVKRKEYFQLEFDIRNHFKMGPVKYYNIIGVMRGTHYPDEYVMAGGHIDSFDSATGGVDCGVGITPTLEAARLIAMAGGKPKRSILFCLWAAEEFGLLGSTHFVNNNPDKLPFISNYFNRDGGPLVPYEITVPPAMYNDFAAIEEAINSINPDFPFKVNKREGEAPEFPVNAGGSDHAPFAKAGVPVFYPRLGDPKGYNFQYREIWHTESDLFNKSIPEYQEHSSVVTAVMLYHLANLDHLLSREGMYKEKRTK
ncbi:MAG: M28 family peptidase [Bacteroidales bacterium]|nr:M28 family peptidase [Bacteroidales bacterium]